MKKEVKIGSKVEKMEIIERIVVDEILFNLTSPEIIETAYTACIPGQKPGFAVINLQTGNLEGRTIDDNDYFLPLEGSVITIYRIGKNLDSSLWPLDVLTESELEEFKAEEEKLDDFINGKGINKMDRTVDFLLNYYEKDLYDIYGQIEFWYGK